MNFKLQKIADAVGKALVEACAASGKSLDVKAVSTAIAEKVKAVLDDKDSQFFVQPDRMGSRVPHLEGVQDAVVSVLKSSHDDIEGYDANMAELTGRLYADYRKKRDEARKQLKVRSSKDNADVTDKALLLGDSKNVLNGWDRERIVSDLKGHNVDDEIAEKVAKETESALLKTGLSSVSSDLVSELVNSVMADNGLPIRLAAGKGYIVDKDFVEGLIKEKSVENSNIVGNNPEAVAFDIASNVFKQYALDNVFSKDIGEAHMRGAIHLHDLNFVIRGYCGSHSIEYIKKWGLKGLVNLNTESKPAKTASVLTGHLNTFLASMQAYYAGALGLGYINVFYAPLVTGMDDKQLHQVAQELIFNGSQNAFSRGGQSLHPDELIWIKENGQYKSVRIGEFVDRFIDGNPEAVNFSERYEVVNTIGEDIQAISFTKEDGKVVDRPIAYVARMPHKGKMYRIHTSNGIVNVTGDHSLFEFFGKGDIRPVKVRDMKKGDFVVIPHKVNLPENGTGIFIPDYIPLDWISVKGFEKIDEALKALPGGSVKNLEKHGFSPSSIYTGRQYDKAPLALARHFIDVNDATLCLAGASKETLPANLQVTPELSYIAGMFCAEGSVRFKYCTISNKDEALLDNVTRCLDTLGYKGYRRYKDTEHGGTADSITITGLLGALLLCTCTDSKEKIVPSWIFTAGQRCIQAYLDGFYDGEGNKRKAVPGQWSVSNTSTRIVSGISLLLLSQGRESYIFESTPREERWKTCYEIREAQRRRINPFTSFTTVDGYEKYKKHINKTIRDKVEWFKDTDLSVSIIKRIEEYDYDGYVYDISVPGTEAFVGGVGNLQIKNTLFLDFNVHSGVPSYLKDVPAIGPGGKYMVQVFHCGEPFIKELTEVKDEKTGDWDLYLDWGNGNPIRMLHEHDGKQMFENENIERHVMRYGDYAEDTARFAEALLEVWKEGDANGHVFEFPKCDFHVSSETFTDARQYQVFRKACEVASHNGSTYFVFDRDSVSLASCCFTGDTKVLVGEDRDPSLTCFRDAYDKYGIHNRTIRVYDRGSWRKAKVIRLSGRNRRVMSVNLACGKHVCVTADHEFPTTRGVLRAYELTPDDAVLLSSSMAEGHRRCEGKDKAQVYGILAGAYLLSGHCTSTGKTIVVGNSVPGLENTFSDTMNSALESAGFDKGVGMVEEDGNRQMWVVTNPEILNGVEKLLERTENGVFLSDAIYRESPAARAAVLIGLIAASAVECEVTPNRMELLLEQIEAMATTIGVICKKRVDGDDVCFSFAPASIGMEGETLVKDGESYLKVLSVKEAMEPEWVYCFTMLDTKDPFFTLPSGIVTHNCRLKVQITDMSLLQHPERLRTLGFQNVTINLPQCAYRAKHRYDREGEGNTDKLNEFFLAEIDSMMDICKAAHLQKKAFVETLMRPGAPLWQMAKPSNDGKPYLDLNTAVYIIGMIGLNDAVHYLTGEEMHESDAAMDYALNVMTHMYLRSKEYTKETGLTFKLEESPAESAARRLAKADLALYREDALKVFKGTEDAAYYTNSIHLSADAPVDIVERIRKQSMFHSIIESGAIIHVFLGESRPTAGAIEELIRNVFLRTQCAQLVFSPEFTYCNECGREQAGLKDTCDQCGSSNVIGITRVVGYYSVVQNWNKSKRYGELKARQRGNYNVEEAK